MGHAVQHLLLGLLQGAPQGRPQIGVKGAQHTRLLRLGNGGIGRASHRLIGHGQGAEVENRRLPDQAHVDFLCGQTHIRAGIAVEAEIPVAVGEGVHHRQGSVNGFVPAQPLDGNTGFHQSSFQLIAEAVLTNLTDEGGFVPQLAQQRQHIAGRAAGVGLQGRISLGAQTVLGQINEQLAQGDNIIVSHNLHLPYTRLSQKKPWAGTVISEIFSVSPVTRFL